MDTQAICEETLPETEAEDRKEKRLTRKQQVFVTEYLRDFNATQAAIRAGYSKRTASVIGSENLVKPDIKQAISARIAELGMGSDEVILRLAEIARSDMGDFLDIGPMGFVVDLNEAKENGKTHLIKKVKMRTTLTSKDDTETEVHDMEVELYSRLEALTTLAKHHGLLIDRTDLTSGGKAIKGYIGISPDDWDNDTPAE